MPNSACTIIDSDLCKETTSLLRPLFSGPEVVAIDSFHCSACAIIDSDLCKETTSLLRPLFSGPEVVAIDSFHCSACAIDSDLCKETTSLLRPLFSGPEVVTIDSFHCIAFETLLFTKSSPLSRCKLLPICTCTYRISSNRSRLQIKAGLV